jgi:hypothetical protein
LGQLKANHVPTLMIGTVARMVAECLFVKGGRDVV